MRILVIDDERLIRRTLRRALAAHTVQTVESCAEAREVLATAAFDLVLSDMHLPDGVGTEIHDWILSSDAQVRRFAFMTGSPMTAAERATMTSRGTQVLTKPFGREEVTRLLDWAQSPE